MTDSRPRLEGSPKKRGFRPDIQGIRAIAVVSVLLAHAEIPWATGGYIGVDVFYVLSGFLITGLIVKEIERDGRVSIRGFYARRAKRILPGATTVLVFVGVVSLIVYTTARQVDVGRDIISAALFVINWHFIAQGVDYFAVEEGLVSPLQHYWTLAVEEQFYVLWPVLLLVIGTLATRFRRRARGAILAVVIPLTIASFVYGMALTRSDPTDAFFQTFARGWELAAGAILALTLPRVIHLPKRVVTPLAIAGVLVILAGDHIFTDASPFPGWRALVPVLGTIALLVAGAAAVSNPVKTMLSTGAFQYVGKISYSMYLWHWPFVVFANAIWGQLAYGWLALATLTSVIPAAIAHKLIEEPFHLSRVLALRPNRALVLGAVCITTSLVAGLALSTNRIDVKELSADEAPGAAVLNNGRFPIENKVKGIRPSPLTANDDKGHAFDEGCLVYGAVVDSPSCTYGDENSDTTVILFGDSHALQYEPAMEVVADEKHWKLILLARALCTPAEVDISGICDRWRDNSLKRIADEDPAMVIIATSTVGNLDLTTEDGKSIVAPESVPYRKRGLVETIDQLKATTDAKLVMMGPQISAPSLPHECVADHLDSLRDCAFPNEPRPDREFDRQAAEETGIELISPLPKLCTKTICPAVIGNVLVYRDTNHMTATYAATLGPWLATKLPKIK